MIFHPKLLPVLRTEPMMNPRNDYCTIFSATTTSTCSSSSPTPAQSVSENAPRRNRRKIERTPHCQQQKRTQIFLFLQPGPLLPSSSFFFYCIIRFLLLLWPTKTFSPNFTSSSTENFETVSRQGHENTKLLQHFWPELLVERPKGKHFFFSNGIREKLLLL